MTISNQVINIQYLYLNGGHKNNQLPISKKLITLKKTNKKIFKLPISNSIRFHDINILMDRIIFKLIRKIETFCH